MKIKSNLYDGVHLFSGGLDSILSYFILKEKGYNPLPVFFETPFFCSDKVKIIAKNNRIDLLVINIFKEYIKILKNPVYGYGKNLNPCIDCKAFMINEAIDIATDNSFKYVSTGEVYNQRPMSQTLSGMEKIEKLLKRKDLLIRPLSHEILKEKFKENVLFKEKKFFSINGRKRNLQLELAKKFNIKDFSTPSGGCLLTYREYSQKLKTFLSFNIEEERYFWMIKHCRIVKFKNSISLIGRDKTDNENLIKLSSKQDKIYQIDDKKGPVGIFIGKDLNDFISFKMEMLKYSKRNQNLLEKIKKYDEL